MKISYFDLALLLTIARLGDKANGPAIRLGLCEFDNMAPPVMKVHVALTKLKKSNLIVSRREEEKTYFWLTKAGRALLAIGDAS